MKKDIVGNGVFTSPVHFKDAQVPAVAVRSGGTPPTFEDLTGLSAVLYGDKFAVDDEMHIIVQLPHSLKLNTDVYPHVHWMPDEAANDGDQVSWELFATWANVGTEFLSGYSMITAVGEESLTGIQAWTHLKTLLTSVTPAANQGGISSIIIARLRRKAASAQEYGGKAVYLGLDFHIENDTDGSRQELVK
jgi:hypothetical protein